MPIKEGPIPLTPSNHNYPLVAGQAGSGIIRARLALGWGLIIEKNIALLNIICPQLGTSPLQDKACKVVTMVTEFWLSEGRHRMVAHIHHPGNSPSWCVGDIWRVKSGDTLAQLLWHNNMAVLWPMAPDTTPAAWTDERLTEVIKGGCKLLNVQPGELDPKELKDEPTPPQQSEVPS